MTIAQEWAVEIGPLAACEAMGVSRATFYREQKPKGPSAPRPPSKRALSEEERQAVLAVCHTEEFVNRPPATIHATLADRGIYLCSVRTMYRILDAAQEVRERRKQATHPVYVKPELCALAPNQVWSWDITDLKGPVRGSRFKLYVTIDLFSRLVVGWTLQHKEDEHLARDFHRENFIQHGIQPGALTLHSDRGAAMVSNTVHRLLLDLQVVRSHGRPHVSDDNPYSESQFKTLKYSPMFPDRFGSIEDGRSFCRRYFHWYNHTHRHSGIGMMTPASVHEGRAEAIYDARQAVLDQAFHAHPERFSKGRPKPPALPGPAWINRPEQLEKEKIA
jgi:putative transposase